MFFCVSLPVIATFYLDLIYICFFIIFTVLITLWELFISFKSLYAFTMLLFLFFLYLLVASSSLLSLIKFFTIGLSVLANFLNNLVEKLDTIITPSIASVDTSRVCVSRTLLINNGSLFVGNNQFLVGIIHERTNDCLPALQYLFLLSWFYPEPSKCHHSWWYISGWKLHLS